MKAQKQTETRERPILFSGEMVRKILSGEKCQTRRVIKPQPHNNGVHGFQTIGSETWEFWGNKDDSGRALLYEHRVKCPFGKVGDLLWVRETFWDAFARTEANNGCVYRADYLSPTANDPAVFHSGNWKPSIYMPRWASRITLEITKVRVERLQDISEADAKAEGITPPFSSSKGWTELPVGHLHSNGFGVVWKGYVAEFQTLWDSINEKRGFGWETNPFVWVIEFKKL